MWPADIAFFVRIEGGVNVLTITGIKVEPIDRGPGDYREILIPNDHFRIAFNRIVLGMTGAHALILSQLFSSGEDRFDFLIAKSGAGFCIFLGVCFDADQAHQNHRKHGYSMLQAESPAGILAMS